MNAPWVISLDFADAASLAPLRLLPGIDVADANPRLWLRGRAADESLTKVLRRLPAVARYDVLPDDRLRRLGCRIPSASLPTLTWQPLSDWLRIAFPVAALPGEPPDRVALRLVRSVDERSPDLLLTRLDLWLPYAERTSLARLEPLQFAADAAGRVLVRGRPLPSLPGDRWVVYERIAVPAGLAWAPAIDAEALGQCWGIPAGSLGLWQADGTLTRVHPDAFVDASRSALRATAQRPAASS